MDSNKWLVLLGFRLSYFGGPNTEGPSGYLNPATVWFLKIITRLIGVESTGK